MLFRHYGVIKIINNDIPFMRMHRVIDWYFSKKALPYWCILLADLLICFFSGIFVFWMYYHGAVMLQNMGVLSRTICIYLIINIICFRLFSTYSGILRYSSFIDLQRVGMAMGTACIAALLMRYLVNPQYKELSFVPLMGRQIIAMYVVATVLMWAMRIMVKFLYDISFPSSVGMRALIYGVKDGGVGLAKNLRDQKPSKFVVKGFISHDSQYQGKMLLGHNVYSVNEKLPEIIKKHEIKAILISPIQNDTFRADEALQNMLIDAGVKIYMTDELKEYGDEDSVSSLKEVGVEDLLPREQIQVNIQEISNLLQNKRILITGSAGSIGSEIVRQVADFKPAELILIDQAETPQHDILLMMQKRWPYIKSSVIVTSVTNAERMETIFLAHKPEIVFHAAAYKHVPMMEDNPSESIQNNVYGTKVLADLSVKYGVKKFVMISTDKAVNPTNVMGCSKRICEIYVQALNNSLENGTQFVTTRFGNVLGSNGSVIPLFRQQIQNGGPVTVTDPNIIRFFMLIPEACRLVLEAGTHGKGGEILVFDMGKPVRILDLAKRMITLSGAKNIDIQYTGLRAGEKLYEEVLSNAEDSLPSFHEKIRVAKVREYDFKQVSSEIDDLIKLSQTYDSMKIVAKMKAIVPEYKSNNSVYSVLDITPPSTK